MVTLDDIGAALFPALMDNTLVVHVYEETQELLHVVFDKLCVCGVGVGGGGVLSFLQVKEKTYEY